MRPDPRHPAFIIFSFIFILTFSVLFKIYLNSKSEWQTARTLVGQNQLQEAVVHFSRSIRWFIPGVSYTESSAQGAWEVALDLENSGRIEDALAAQRVLRSSFFSIRGFGSPGREWINRCNEKIAALMAGRPALTSAQKQKSFEQRKAENLELLSRERAPSRPWAFASEMGFLGWIACGLAFIFKGISPSGELRTRPAAAWSGGFIFFYCVWLVGLFNV